MTEKTYRDRLETVDAEGNRKWVYAKKPHGRFVNYRNLVAYSLIAFMVSAPLIDINGHPMVLLDVLNRKFVLFGKVFWPQDFYLVVFLFLILLVSLILFTVIFGRIFCGWVCPQTIFMESVFRRIEYLIEGDYMKQKKLDRMDWNAEKIFKKGLKHGVFLLISILIANILLAFVIGREELFKIVTEPISAHWVGFLSMLGFSGGFYFVFSKLRENVCSMACPYGRLQGVMLDKKSVVVAYDFERGEPRGKLRKGEERTLGDCIDCHQCVHVCPAGIDIRNGTQLECINCAACIDACDDIMDKINKPRGLVRYASMENIEKGKKFHWDTRKIAYSVVLVLMLCVAGLMFIDRGELDATVLRAQGTVYQKIDEQTFRNIYNVKIINKSAEDFQLNLALKSPKGTLQVVGRSEGEALTLPAEGIEGFVLLIDIKRDDLEGMKTPVELSIINAEDNSEIKVEKTNFIGPYN